MMIECNRVGGNMYLVEALDTYKSNNIPDMVLGRIPEPGERFEVNEDRLNVLLGKNIYGKAFVKVIEEPKKEVEVKPKRTIKKKTTK